MKKILILTVMMFLTSLTFSQNRYKVLKVITSTYKNNEWVVTETEYPKKMYLTIKDWDIKLGNRKLKTYGQYEKNEYDDHITFTWNANDSDGADCYFIMKKFDPKITNHMIYSVVYIPPTEFYYPIMIEYETEN